MSDYNYQPKVNDVQKVGITAKIKAGLLTKFQRVRNYLIVWLIVGVGMTVGLNVLDKSGNFGGLFVILYFVGTVVFLIWQLIHTIRFHGSGKANSWECEMQERTENFIKHNGFLKVRVKTISDESGNKYEQEIVDYQPSVRYLVNADNQFVWTIRLDGSQMSEKYKTLEDKLQNVFYEYHYNHKEITVNNVMYYFDFMKPERLRIVHDTDFKQIVDENKISLGMGHEWQYRKCPHSLVCGGTGGGKTFFLIFLLKTFYTLGADVYICDPKNSELCEIGATAKKIAPDNIATSEGQIAKVLRIVNEEMESRYVQMKAVENKKLGADYVDCGYKPVVIFVDEMAAFMSSADKKVAAECMKYISNMVLKGRQAGIQCIIGMQRPDVTYLNGSIRDNLSLRCVLGAMTSDGYSMVFGSTYNDLENIDSVKGSGFCSMLGREPFQYVSPYMEFQNVSEFMNGKGENYEKVE